MPSFQLPAVIPDDIKPLLNVAIKATQKAGLLALEIRGGYLEASTKKDGTIVTQADLECQKLIEKILTKSTSYKVIGEEAFPDPYAGDLTPDTFKDETYWLVDPIDGTKGYYSGNDEFCINIALMTKGYPHLGVVYIPATKETFFGIEHIGAWKLENNACKAISVKKNPKKLRVLSSSGNINLDALHARVPKQDIKSITPLGSAIKMVRIAEGSADYHLRTGPTMKWDTAAPQAILEAAGGELVDLYGKRMSCVGPKWLNPFFEAKASSASDTDVK